jgi:methionyl aminopeptidase
MIYIKDTNQINSIRKSCKLAKECLDLVSDHVKEGISTQYLNEIINNHLKNNNAFSATLGYMGYPKETCISKNEVVCHGIPSDKEILKDGDILNIDVALILNGYYGDTSRMFFVGNVDENAKKLVKVTEECLCKGIQEVKPGIPVNRIGYAITKHAHSNGYSVVFQFVGHGCGIKFHEEPKILHYVTEEEKDNGVLMRPGMIFTIEPMLNIGTPKVIIENDNWTAKTMDKKLSAQFEHMILVTEDGFEILT